MQKTFAALIFAWGLAALPAQAAGFAEPDSGAICATGERGRSGGLFSEKY